MVNVTVTTAMVHLQATTVVATILNGTTLPLPIIFVVSLVKRTMDEVAAVA